MGVAPFRLEDFAGVSVEKEPVAQTEMLHELGDEEPGASLFLEQMLDETVDAFEFLEVSFDALPRITFRELDSGRASAGYNPWYDVVAVAPSLGRARKIPVSAYIGHELVHRKDWHDIGVIDWDAEARTGHVAYAEDQLDTLQDYINDDPHMKGEWQRYRMNQLDNRIDAYAFAALAQELDGDLGTRIEQTVDAYSSVAPRERKDLVADLGDYIQERSEETGIQRFPIRDVGESVPHAWTMYAAGIFGDEDAVKQYLDETWKRYDDSFCYGTGSGVGVRSAIEDTVEAYRSYEGIPAAKMRYLLTEYREKLHEEYGEPLCS